MSKPFQPPWLDHALRDLGVAEGSGATNSPRVLAYYRDAYHPEIKSDSVAWCAAFAGAILERAGVTSTRSLLARSYLRWGDALEEPRFGAIAVLSRGADPNAGHVGFLIGVTATHLYLLGGNQSDAVTIDAFARDRLLALRWPAQTAQTTTPLSTFEVAIEHVLLMEGGYTDDPHDPGGPTNLGITHTRFAEHRGIVVSPETYGQLKADLRALSLREATEIYRRYYWQPSSAAWLPPALAFMHFDTAVNQGPNTADRMLQTALAVVVDGEIGPETLAAAQRCALEPTLTRYAEIRVKHYRALPHFWRFGRGWLNRVEKTRIAALSRINDPNPELPESLKLPQGKVPTMTQQASNAEPKWWGNSITIWGTILTALTNVLPALAPIIGFEITPELVKQIGLGVTQFLQAAGGLIGTLMAIYGRYRAFQPLVRRDVKVKL